ncbi:MAG: rhomboid family intramembrane serine protease [Fimbriimonadaceae bacterium]|nr:rhomboid family intramembrane serine protease [Fimbriimonadaceae bacterium]
MILPIRSKNPPESIPWATCTLIGLNVVMFLATSEGGEIRDSALREGGLTVQNASPLTFLSSMFLHADFFHLAGNMWFLYLFGFAVEGRLKWYRFLPVYLLSGVAGDLFQWALGEGARSVPSLGASGAIMGVLGAGLWMFPYAKIDVVYFFSWWWYGIYEASLWLVGLYYLGVDFLLGSLMSLGGASGGVAHWAHVGGAVVGFLTVAVLRQRRDSSQTSTSKSTWAESKDIRLLAPWELRDLAEGSPHDTYLAHSWMWQSLQRRQVSKECLAHFLGLLPELVDEEDPEALAGTLAALCTSPVVLPAGPIMGAAASLEAKGVSNHLETVYLAVRQWRHATDADLEVATFRLAKLKQRRSRRSEDAARLYEEVVRRWPMGPFAGPAAQAVREIRQSP